MSKKTKAERSLDFLAGKGFYIILFVCVAAIAISGYVLIFSGKDSDTSSLDVDLSEKINWVVTSSPSMRPVIPSGTPKIPASGDSSDNSAVAVANPTDLPIPNRNTPIPVPSVSPVPYSDVMPKETPVPHNTPVKAAQFFWPVPGEVVVGHSIEDLVYNNTMEDYRVHKGIDIETDLGVQVLASGDGIVKDINSSDQWGTYVTIQHSDGIVTLYANLQKNPAVIIDQQVTAGTVLGGVGQTAECEIAEAPHLHFEMTKDGKLIDPMGYLPNKD